MLSGFSLQRVRIFMGSFRLLWKLASFLNLLFFGAALVTGVLASIFIPAPLASGAKVFTFPSFVAGNGFLLFLFIFTLNVAFSAFVVVTLPGFLFFPLSISALAYRGLLWGMLIYALPTWAFLVLLPVMILKGEAYVFAAAAGASVGLSWLRPKKGLKRLASLRNALQQCVHTYTLVVALLLAAAAVETATVVLTSL